jgi:hypothetical protein
VNNIQFFRCMQHLVDEMIFCSLHMSRGSLLCTMTIINGVWLIVVLLRVIFTSSISLGVVVHFVGVTVHEKFFLRDSWYWESTCFGVFRSGGVSVGSRRLSTSVETRTLSLLDMRTTYLLSYKSHPFTCFGAKNDDVWMKGSNVNHQCTKDQNCGHFRKCALHVEWYGAFARTHAQTESPRRKTNLMCPLPGHGS